MEIDKKEYGKYVKQVTPVHNTWKNLWRAFLVGGLICMLGQVFTSVYMSFGIEKESAAAWTTLSLIGLSVILTGFHVYQKIVKFGGAGALVPITGFANSVVSPAIEYKAEGHVFGIGCKIFTIAGPVILYRNLCELGAGDGEVFLEILVNEPAGTYNGREKMRRLWSI
ncbi:MAG: SpoVA/SpoVAEb family sporulation membrane protein [Pilosibacter sp.]